MAADCGRGGGRAWRSRLRYYSEVEAVLNSNVCFQSKMGLTPFWPSFFANPTGIEPSAGSENSYRTPTNFKFILPGMIYGLRSAAAGAKLIIIIKIKWIWTGKTISWGCFTPWMYLHQRGAAENWRLMDESDKGQTRHRAALAWRCRCWLFLRQRDFVFLDGNDSPTTPHSPLPHPKAPMSRSADWLGDYPRRLQSRARWARSDVIHPVVWVENLNFFEKNK